MCPFGAGTGAGAGAGPPQGSGAGPQRPGGLGSSGLARRGSHMEEDGIM